MRVSALKHGRGWLCVTLFLGATIISSGAWASDAERPTQAVRQARALYKQSRKAYSRGEFDKAASLIRAAQLLDPHPVLVYNLARALEAAGKTEEAISNYRKYIEVNPRAKDRGFAEGRITALSKQLEEKRALQQKLARAQVARSSRDRAVALSREADGHAREGRYRMAVKLYRDSYAMAPEPIFLLRLGRALERLGETAEAAQSYRTFLEVAPNSPRRSTVKARLATLVGRASESTPTAPAANRVDATIPQASSVNVAAVVLTVTGAGALVAGGVLGALAKSKHDSWEDASRQADARARLDEADDLALGANVVLGVGATLAVAGGIWWLVDALDDDPVLDVTIAPTITEPGAQFGFRF